MIQSNERLLNSAAWVSIACVLFLLSGCAASGFSHKKWVEGNAVHSEGMPKLTIKVDDDFDYKDSDAKINNALGSDQISKSTRVNTKLYNFVSKDKRRGVTVKIESIHEHNWYMNEVDFKGMDGVLEASTVTLNDTSFNTAIFAQETDTGTLLIKIYSSTYGSDCRMEIFYAEQVDNTWLKTDSLSVEKIKSMREYSQRADASFKIMPLASVAKTSG